MHFDFPDWATWMRFGAAIILIEAFIYYRSAKRSATKSQTGPGSSRVSAVTVLQNLNFAREVVIRSHLAGQLGLALIFWVAFIGFGHWSTWVVLAVFCGAASEPISMVVGRYRSKAPEQEAMHGTARVARVSDLESNDFVRRRDRRR